MEVTIDIEHTIHREEFGRGTHAVSGERPISPWGSTALGWKTRKTSETKHYNTYYYLDSWCPSGTRLRLNILNEATGIYSYKTRTQAKAPHRGHLFRRTAVLVMLEICAPCTILEVRLLRSSESFGVHGLFDLDVDVDRL